MSGADGLRKLASFADGAEFAAYHVAEMGVWLADIRRRERMARRRPPPLAPQPAAVWAWAQTQGTPFGAGDVERALGIRRRTACDALRALAGRGLLWPVGRMGTPGHKGGVPMLYQLAAPADAGPAAAGG